MDDIIATSSDPKAIDKLIDTFSIAFLVKDLGPLSFFLEVEESDGADLFLTQRQYISDLLCRVNLDKVKLCNTPMSTT